MVEYLIMGKGNAVAILLLAGKGERFSASSPKQFIKMGEKELFLYAASSLDVSKRISSIVYVVPPSYERETESILKREGLGKEHFVISGGNNRQESVYFALSFLAKQGINEDDIVLIQDGDRPNLRQSYIDETIEKAVSFGAAVTAIHVSDSIALGEDGSVLSYYDRSKLYALQTPQAFRFSLIFEAENRARIKEKFYTDEGSLLLGEMGKSSQIVIGDKSNIKITEPFDEIIFLAKSL